MAGPAKNRDKNGHLFWFVPQTSYFYLTFLRRFVPHLEVLFCCNHYFLVCIFKYHTSLHVNSGLEI